MIISFAWSPRCVRCKHDVRKQKDQYSIVIQVWGPLMSRFRICQRCAYEGVAVLGEGTTTKKLAEWMEAPKRGG